MSIQKLNPRKEAELSMQPTGHVITNKNASDKTQVAYIRCSSVDQKEGRQLSAFEHLNIYKIYVEKASAKDTKRPLLQKMLKAVKAGDTIYVHDFSRIARSTRDLLNLVESLNERGVKLISLKEHLDTSTPTGKLMLTVIGAINTFERECMLERQREGILIAQREGKYKGRKPIEKPENWNEVYTLWRSQVINSAEAMARLRLTRSTFYKLTAKQKSIDEAHQLP